MFSVTTGSSTGNLYRQPEDKPYQDLNWLEMECIQQSLQFMIDLLPTIRRLVKGWPRHKVLEVLDIGSASGAGANLLGTLHRSNFFGARMKVDAMDISSQYKEYALHSFKDLNSYIVGNIFELDKDRSWDLVICSHTIEHIKKSDVFDFIKELQRRARHWAVFYTPYKEQKLLQGEHLSSFNYKSFSTLNPWLVKIIRDSPGWKHPIDKESRCVLFVLNGLNRKASTASAEEEVKIKRIKRELIEERHDYQLAINELSTLLERLPANGNLNYLMGYCLHRSNRNLDKALRYYERALEHGFDEFYIRFHEGSLYYQLGDHGSARTLLKKAASLKPFHEPTKSLLRKLESSSEARVGRS